MALIVQEGRIRLEVDKNCFIACLDRKRVCSFHFSHLMKQLSSVERYALSQVEFYEGDWKREQLAAADAQIEAQRKEFDARKLQDAAENAVGASSVANSTTEDEVLFCKIVARDIHNEIRLELICVALIDFLPLSKAS